MKLKSLLLELYKDIIHEIFDFENIEILDFHRISNNSYKFEYNNFEINVIFQDAKYEDFEFKQKFLKNTNSVVNMSFSVNDVEDQADKTDISILLPIYNTLRYIATEYITTKKPDIVICISTNRYGKFETDSGKDRIYELIMRKYTPPNYGVGQCTFKPANLSGFCLYKIK